MKISSTSTKYLLPTLSVDSKSNNTLLKHLHKIEPLSSISSAKTIYITMSKTIDAFTIAQKKSKKFTPFIVINKTSEFVTCLNTTIYVPDDSDFIFIPSNKTPATKTEQYHFIRSYNIEDYDALLCCSPLALVAFQRCVFNSYFLDCSWDKQLQTILAYYMAYIMQKAIHNSKESIKTYKKNLQLQDFSFSSYPAMSTTGYLCISDTYTTHASNKKSKKKSVDKTKKVSTVIPSIVHSIDHTQKKLDHTISINTNKIHIYNFKSLTSLAQSLLSLQNYAHIQTLAPAIRKHIYGLLLVLEHGGAFYEHTYLCLDSLFSSHIPVCFHHFPSLYTDYSKDTLYIPPHAVSIQEKNSVLLCFEQAKAKQYMVSFHAKTFSTAFFAAKPQAKLISVLLEDALQTLEKYNSKNNKKLLLALQQSYTRVLLQELFCIDANNTTTMHKELLKEIHVTLQQSPYFTSYIFDNI